MAIVGAPSGGCFESLGRAGAGAALAGEDQINTF
jgi:hypothetical protein